MLWFTVKWLPSLEFSLQSLKNMFSFGSKLILVGLLDMFQKNILNVIIGKYFTMTDLGYFNRSEAIKKGPTITISKILQRVFFPVFSEIQDDEDKILRGIKKTIKYVSIISFPLIFMIITLAEPIVLTLLGSNWLPMVPYLRLLTLSALLYPVESICQVFLKARGNAKEILQIEIVKVLMYIPIIILGIKYGIIFLIYGIIGKSIISYLIYAFSVSRHLNYTVYRQIIHLLFIITRSIIMGIIVMFSTRTLANPAVNLILGLTVAVISYVVLTKILNYNDYKEIKQVLLNKLHLTNTI